MTLHAPNPNLNEWVWTSWIWRRLISNSEPSSSQNHLTMSKPNNKGPGFKTCGHNCHDIHDRMTRTPEMRNVHIFNTWATRSKSIYLSQLIISSLLLQSGKWWACTWQETLLYAYFWLPRPCSWPTLQLAYHWPRIRQVRWLFSGESNWPDTWEDDSTIQGCLGSFVPWATCSFDLWG